MLTLRILSVYCYHCSFDDSIVEIIYIFIFIIRTKIITTGDGTIVVLPCWLAILIYIIRTGIAGCSTIAVMLSRLAIMAGTVFPQTCINKNIIYIIFCHQYGICVFHFTLTLRTAHIQKIHLEPTFCF